jgi:hypothetical protein
VKSDAPNGAYQPKRRFSIVPRSGSSLGQVLQPATSGVHEFAFFLRTVIRTPRDGAPSVMDFLVDRIPMEQTNMSQALLFPMRATVISLAISLVVPTAAEASGVAFTPGDLFLYSPAVTGISSVDGAVVRIDPTTGNASIFVDLALTQGWQGSLAYDPYRERLLFCASLNGGNGINYLWAADGAGNTQNLGHASKTFWALAPRGDGIVYLRDGSSNAGRVWYLDANNQLATLQDESGTQPFHFAPGTQPWFTTMTYHAGTNSLVVAGPSQLGVACGGGENAGVVVRRATLSADGTRAIGPVLCAEFNVSPGSDVPTGLTALPDGRLLLVVDTNSNEAEPRLLHVDPWTMTITTNGGTWSSALGKAVVLDTFNDVLRAFAPGEGGIGAVITTSTPLSSSGSSNEVATLIEVASPTCAGSSVTYGSGLAGAGSYVPSLTAEGCALPGGTLVIHMASAVGAANGVLFVGLTPSALPLAGGTLLVYPIVSAIPIAVGGSAGISGAGSLSFPVLVPPNPTLTGLSAFLQVAFLDPAAVKDVSFTGGLQLTFG